MPTVGTYELKTHLSALLKRVEAGESFTVTHHGKPVAVLAPAARPGAADLASVVEEIRAFRARHPLGGLTIRDLIDEGRRL